MCRARCGGLGVQRTVRSPVRGPGTSLRGPMAEHEGNGGGGQRGSDSSTHLISYRESSSGVSGLDSPFGNGKTSEDTWCSTRRPLASGTRQMSPCLRKSLGDSHKKWGPCSGWKTQMALTSRCVNAGFFLSRRMPLVILIRRPCSFK